MREVIAGCNYKSQNELVLHFGLNEALMMDEIQVMWPGGATRTLSNHPTNQTWTLYPTGKLGDADQDGDRDLDDSAFFENCFTGDAPGSIQPGCEMMDFDGNGAVDCFDWDQFALVWTESGDPPDFLPCPAFAPIPTVSQWGLIVMTLLLLATGTVAYRCTTKNKRATGECEQAA